MIIHTKTLYACWLNPHIVAYGSCGGGFNVRLNLVLFIQRRLCYKQSQFMKTVLWLKWWLYILGKSPFLTIQLLPRFGFGHRTLKPDILTIQLLKLFTIDHQAVLMGGFNFFIYNLVLQTWNDHYFLLVAPN
jgi:hypothetical protein